MLFVAESVDHTVASAWRMKKRILTSTECVATFLVRYSQGSCLTGAR